MKAIIPAAGLGSRFLPATKAQPKEMLPVVDKPVIQYIVEEALTAGASEVVIVNSHDKKSIEEHFSSSPQLEEMLRQRGKDAYAEAVGHAGSLPVSFVYQEEPLGLGHSVLQAAPKTAGEPFAVMLGDVLVPDNDILPAMETLSAAHGGASVIAVAPVPESQVSRFGIVGCKEEDDGALRITKMVEKPALEDAPSRLAIVGRYLLSPKVMELLESTAPGAGGEIQLTDALVELLKTENVYALVIDGDQLFDTGTVDSWIAANVALGLRNGKTALPLREALAPLFA